MKIPFTQRVDHSKKRTLRQSFVVGASDLPPMPAWQPKVWSVASSRALRSQFRDPDQVEGRAADNQSTFASPRSFTFFRGPICFSHPNGFSTSQRLLKLIA